ncbi:MAG: CPBP family intramembrane metalloprotease [Cyanobacteria bacterium]|nr:CPBP family intramembrane metalloprotease [Cyanobacteriota bacterium]
MAEFILCWPLAFYLWLTRWATRDAASHFHQVWMWQLFSACIVLILGIGSFIGLCYFSVQGMHQTLYLWVAHLLFLTTVALWKLSFLRWVAQKITGERLTSTLRWVGFWFGLLLIITGFLQAGPMSDTEGTLLAFSNLPKYWWIDSIWTLLSMMLISVVGAGLFNNRNLTSTLERLGFLPETDFSGTGPFWKKVLIFTAVGLLLSLFLYYVGLYFLKPQYPQLYALDHAFNQAITPHNIPVFHQILGILTIALCAGIGEELLLRGLMQPVLGIGLTTVVFTLMHPHYGLSGLLLIIALLGLIFGLIRQRYGIVAAIVTHFAYDFVTMGLTALGF